MGIDTWKEVHQQQLLQHMAYEDGVVQLDFGNCHAHGIDGAMPLWHQLVD
jgi:hypothetical protein